MASGAFAATVMIGYICNNNLSEQWVRGNSPSFTFFRRQGRREARRLFFNRLAIDQLLYPCDELGEGFGALVAMLAVAHGVADTWE